eukprot:2137330-Pyramimonas_sp.AAC.1
MGLSRGQRRATLSCVWVAVPWHPCCERGSVRGLLTDGLPAGGCFAASAAPIASAVTSRTFLWPVVTVGWGE